MTAALARRLAVYGLLALLTFGAAAVTAAYHWAFERGRVAERHIQAMALTQAYRARAVQSAALGADLADARASAAQAMAEARAARRELRIALDAALAAETPEEYPDDDRPDYACRASDAVFGLLLDALDRTRAAGAPARPL